MGTFLGVAMLLVMIYFMYSTFSRVYTPAHHAISNKYLEFVLGCVLSDRNMGFMQICNYIFLILKPITLFILIHICISLFGDDHSLGSNERFLIWLGLILLFFTTSSEKTEIEEYIFKSANSGERLIVILMYLMYFANLFSAPYIVLIGFTLTIILGFESLFSKKITRTEFISSISRLAGNYRYSMIRITQEECLSFIQEIQLNSQADSVMAAVHHLKDKEPDVTQFRVDKEEQESFLNFIKDNFITGIDLIFRKDNTKVTIELTQKVLILNFENHDEFSFKIKELLEKRVNEKSKKNAYFDFMKLNYGGLILASIFIGVILYRSSGLMSYIVLSIVPFYFVMEWFEKFLSRYPIFYSHTATD